MGPSPQTPLKKIKDSQDDSRLACPGTFGQKSALLHKMAFVLTRKTNISK
jgi:hypothetical protein